MTRKRRTLLLACIVVVLGVAAALMLPSDPLIAARLAEIQNSVSTGHAVEYDPNEAAKLDIALGAALPNAGVGNLIRNTTRSSHKGYLLVGLGDCATCSRFDVATWQRQANEAGVPLIGFSEAGIDKIDEFKRLLRASFPIFNDPSHVLRDQLNSYWAGRVYYFDSNWHLVWMMKDFSSNSVLRGEPDLVAAIGAMH